MSSQRQHHQSTSCRAKRNLLRGVRPNTHSHSSPIELCSHSCIYCDIWQLGIFVFSRVPSTPPQSPTSSSPSSPRSSSSYRSSSRAEWESEHSYKLIEAGYQTQRARMNSILSICTVEGAGESEGLRMAHDRCLIQVNDLINQERMLEERAERQQMQDAYEQQYHSQQLQYTQQQHSASMSSMSHDCGRGASRQHINGNRTSRVTTF